MLSHLLPKKFSGNLYSYIEKESQNVVSFNANFPWEVRTSPICLYGYNQAASRKFALSLVSVEHIQTGTKKLSQHTLMHSQSNLSVKELHSHSSKPIRQKHNS